MYAKGDGRLRRAAGPISAAPQAQTISFAIEAPPEPSDTAIFGEKRTSRQVLLNV